MDELKKVANPMYHQTRDIGIQYKNGSARELYTMESRGTSPDLTDVQFLTRNDSFIIENGWFKLRIGSTMHWIAEDNISKIEVFEPSPIMEMTENA